MSIVSKEPTPEMIQARQEMIEVLKKFGDSIQPLDQVAVIAYTLGQLMALQDQRTVTVPMLIELVQINIERGNQDAMEHFLSNPQGQA